ncbi:uncharacterized protein [Aegilops tauschii subsp. strangulata]|uniref:uncharacterized protein isoform X5 n=1 Tax=Aegilops tauschii subsp. strangulata TaxID=200361 RepID=UPI001ABCB6DB|nr:uncharacterized protein LOC109762326 isoform X5 [Aegilops tauschii subsp. strangulata]
MQRTRTARDARWWSWVVMRLCAAPSTADRRSKLPLHAADSSRHCPLLPPMWPSSSVHYWLVGSSSSPTPEDGDVCMYTCVLEIGELIWWCVRAAASSSGRSNAHPQYNFLLISLTSLMNPARTEACRQAGRWANHCCLSTSFPEKLPCCGLTWRLLLHVDTIAGPTCY